MSDIDSLSAYDLSRLLRDRKISAVEVMTHCLAQIEKSNHDVNAVVTLDTDQAMTMAKEADQISPDGRLLHGLPLGVKDCFDIAGMRGTSGSRVYENRIAKDDTLHVARLQKAGALPFAKLNTPEFTMGGQTTNAVFGTTCNPYDLAKTTTGSSGGSGAAMAAKMTLISDGSDIGGSVRSPAGACNIVGFRPSHGVIPANPANDPYGIINTPGPMTRTVTDAALMLLIMSGRDAGSPVTSRLVDVLSDVIDPPKIGGTRIAWSYSPAGTQTDDEIATVLDECRPVFKNLGCVVDDYCPDLNEAHRAQHILCPIAYASELRRHLRDTPDLLLPHTRSRLEYALGFSADLIVSGMEMRTRSWAILNETFNRYDVMVWPTNPQKLFGIDRVEGKLDYDWRPVEISPTFGLPSISIPGGFSSDGLPVGLQIIGRPGADETVLRIARAFEAETEFWKTLPPIVS